MKLFIIDNVLNEYFSGTAIIKAESLAQAREIFIERFTDGSCDTSEYETKFYGLEENFVEVLDLADTDQTPAGFVKVIFGGR